MKQIQKCKVAQGVKLLLSSSADKDSKRNLDRATDNKNYSLVRSWRCQFLDEGSLKSWQDAENELLRASCWNCWRHSSCHEWWNDKTMMWKCFNKYDTMLEHP